MNKYVNLLKSWCDKLIELQITELKDKNYYGGIMCPACSMIHGRIGDAVYPFVFLYDLTGEVKYLDAAKKVIDWSEFNIRRENGGYFNDKCNSWMGISAFSATAIGDALLYHGKCLNKEIKDRWMEIFKRITDFVYVYFDRPGYYPNINYWAGEAALMALAFVLCGDEKYKQKAYERFRAVQHYFTDDGLLYGEGKRTITENKGCYFVDLGYNVEESLPLMAKFAHLMNDEECMKFVADKFRVHIEFILPDGAWDNSWGSRANKWTYWGSRTSDGAGEGLCYLAKYDDIFAEAAQRNFELLERCSGDGYLYGGLMYKEYGEEPCTHHSFCHAKALAAMLDSGFEYKGKTELPRDKACGIKYFPSIHVNLISTGSMRATVSDNEAVHYPGAAVTGGTISVLWSSKTGIILSAVMANYGMSEPRNMQFSRYDDTMPNCAMRISNGSFESVNDKEATVVTNVNGSTVSVSAKGVLKNTLFESDAEYELNYIFEENDTLTVKAKAGCDAKLLVPVICSKTDAISCSENSVVISKSQASVTVKCDGTAITAPEDTSFRNFTVIGGFASYPIQIELKKDEEVTVVIKITDLGKKA